MSEAQTIVTGETREAFMNHRMGLSEPVKETVVDEPIEAELEAVEEEVEVEEEHREEKKHNSKLEKRFSDLTKQREDAKADTLRERTEKEALIERLKAYEDKPKAAVVDASIAPDAANYQDAFEYAKDLAKWSANDALATRDKQDQNKVAEQERAKVVSSWNERLAATKLDVPGYDDIIANSTVGVSDLVRDSILESDVGPKILLHLAQNPEFTEKLGKLSASAALREIGRLEAKYEIVAETVKDPVKAKVKLSRSAEPISPIRGGRSLEVELSADGEFTGTFAAYAAARKAGKLK